MFEETPGRKFTKNYVWDFVGDMETVIEKEEDVSNKASEITNNHEETVVQIFDNNIEINEATDTNIILTTNDTTNNFNEALDMADMEEIEFDANFHDDFDYDPDETTTAQFAPNSTETTTLTDEPQSYRNGNIIEEEENEIYVQLKKKRRKDLGELAHGQN